jgi:hypothetical protein
MRPALAIISAADANPGFPIANTIRAAEAALDTWCRDAKIAA